MKKKLNILFTAIIILFIIAPINKVFAASSGNVLTMEISQNSGKLYVSGTTDEDVLAVAVAVYKEGVSELAAVQTAAVNENQEYSTLLELQEGKYFVRAANYNGGPFVEKSFTFTNNSLEEEEIPVLPESEVPEKSSRESVMSENPKTTDNILIAVVVCITSLLVILLIIKMNKKFKNK